jgi:hypothetical protein
MSRNLVSRIVGSVLVLCENQQTPSDAEWNHTLELLVQLQKTGQNVKVLVITEGGGPNSQQRKQLERTLGAEGVPVAVVSDSLKMRFISAGVALINPGHKGFTRAEVSDAYDHLKLTGSEARQAEMAVRQMLKELVSDAVDDESR